MKRKVLALLLTVLMVVPAVSMVASATTRNSWQDFSADGTFVSVAPGTGADVAGLYTVYTNDANGVYALVDADGQVTTVDAAYAAGAAGSDGDHYTTITTNYKVALNGFNAAFKNYAAQPYGTFPAFTTSNLMTPTISFAWTTSPVQGGFSGRGQDVGDAEVGQLMGLLSGYYHVGDTNPLIDNGVVLNFSTRTGNYYAADGSYYWNFSSCNGNASGNNITYALWADFAVYENNVCVYTLSKDNGATGPAYIYTQDDLDFTTEAAKEKRLTASLSGSSLTIEIDEDYRPDKFSYTFTDASIARLSPYRDYYFSMSGVSDGRGTGTFNQYAFGGVNFGIAKVWGRAASSAKASGTKYLDALEDTYKNNDEATQAAFGMTTPTTSVDDARSALRISYTVDEAIATSMTLAAFPQEDYIGVSHKGSILGVGATVRKGASNGNISYTNGVTSANSAAAEVFRDGVQIGKVIGSENGSVSYSLYLYNIANRDQQYRFRQYAMVGDGCDLAGGATTRYQFPTTISFNQAAA